MTALQPWWVAAGLHQPCQQQGETEKVHHFKWHVKKLPISKQRHNEKKAGVYSLMLHTNDSGQRMHCGVSAYAGVRSWANQMDGEWLQESKINLLKYLYLYYKVIKVKEPLLFHKMSHLCSIILISPCHRSTNLQIFHFLFYRVVVPFVKTCLMVLPSVQTVWKSLTDVFVMPFFQSLGRCFAMVNIRLDQE